MQRVPLHPLLRLIRRGRGALLLGVLALLGGATDRVPWPGGVAPDPLLVRTRVQEALALSTRERMDEYKSAAQPDEERESLILLSDHLQEIFSDPELVFIVGDAFFGHNHRADAGFGGLVQGPKLHRVHRGLAGGLDTQSCMGCHSVGGADGAGATTQNALLLGDGDALSSAQPRNPPALLGLGLIQSLAVEMSADLVAQRDQGLARARASGEAREVALRSKGVDFGRLVAQPDGRLDTSGVRGVSADLVVRPFGWKGDVARLRRFTEEAARLHFGAQSTELVARAKAHPDPARLGEGPWWDPDQDGISREIEEGSLTASAAYLAMLETPVILPPQDPGLLDRWGEGSRRFDALGCAECHRRALRLDDRIWVERPDDPDGEPITINLLSDGEAPRGTDQVALFSDLQRHAMGPALADTVPHPDGLPLDQFLTRPLWGLAESAPYLHDGRAVTLPQAILAHGGEAQAARDAYAALSEKERADLTIFLLSLTRAPRPRVSR